MKSRLTGSFVYAGIVTGVVGVFYMIGQLQGVQQTKPNATVRQLSKVIPETVAVAERTSGFPPLSAEEALRRFINAQSGGDMIRATGSILFGIKLADIPALIKALGDLPDSQDKDNLIQSLLLKLAKDNPSLALSLSGYLHDDSLRTFVVLGAFAQLAKANPAQALSQWSQMEPGSLKQAALGRVFQALGSTLTPADVEALVDSLPAGSERDTALKGLVSGWVKADPKAALDFASNLPPEYSALLKSTITNVAIFAGQPALAAQYVNQIQDAAVRDAAIAALMPVWSGGPKKNPEAALDWLNQAAVSGNTYSKSVATIFSNVANNDPASGTNLLSKVTDLATLQASITTVASGWGETDPQAALTWAQTLAASDAGAQTSALNAIVSSWSKNDPNAVVAYVQNSADPSVFLSSDPAIAQSLAGSNPQAALAFSNSLPDGTAKNQALNNVLSTVAQTDITSAWSYASANLPPGAIQNTIMTNLVATEAKADPAQAAALLNSIPDGTAQLNATSALATTWIKLDPQAFTVWLNTLPAGDVRDTAITQLASSTQATRDPAAVMNWVNSVSNPQTKAELLQKLTPAQAAAK